ncbi:unnamed protein product [Heterobilharzia americana]|nr:unnamed protein product [Heterobilharzia americana]
MIDEMKNPKKHLPIAIVVSCVLVTAVYTFANVAYATVVPVAEILSTRAVAVTFAVRMYGVMWWIMPIFVACSTFGGANGTVLTTSRIFFVASQVNQMPAFISYLHTDWLTPIPAVLFTCVMSSTSCQGSYCIAYIYVLVTLFLIVFAFVGSPKESLYGVLIILTGIPVYIIGCAWTNKPKSFKQTMESFTVGLQKLLRIVPSS